MNIYTVLVFQQVATPPLRPQTQSPVAPGIMQPISQPISQPMHQYTYTVMPPMHQGPQPVNQNYKPIKRGMPSNKSTQETEPLVRFNLFRQLLQSF